MRISKIFTKTQKISPRDEESANAIYLERGGFIYKNSAGVYTYLPLGWRVIEKISAIIREEMNSIGATEMFMPALHDKKYLSATGRWDIDVVFKVISGSDKEPNFNISWTHEEIAAEIASRYVSSYKDLPFSFYQIQTKFRNEPRAKSGLLRGREFLMKDLYSFHTSQEDLFSYYEKTREAYQKIFSRCGLKSIYTVAAGGDFTVSNTHEFQVIAPIGEDTIFVCSKCDYAENNEISKFKDGSECSQCGGKIIESKSIEVGNIFPLGTKYSDAFNLNFKDEKGEKHPVVMGSYGIGISRVMGAVVEVYHDEKGIMWPKNIAPFPLHLIGLNAKEAADKIYDDFVAEGVELLYDDRGNVSAGEKFADADLIGIPMRLVVSEKTLKEHAVEIKKRDGNKTEMVAISDLRSYINKNL